DARRATTQPAAHATSGHAVIRVIALQSPPRNIGGTPAGGDGHLEEVHRSFAVYALLAEVEARQRGDRLQPQRSGSQQPPGNVLEDVAELRRLDEFVDLRQGRHPHLTLPAVCAGAIVLLATVKPGVVAQPVE